MDVEIDEATNLLIDQILTEKDFDKLKRTISNCSSNVLNNCIHKEINDHHYHLSPFMAACRWRGKEMEILRLFLDRAELNVNLTDRNGFSALHVCIESAFEESSIDTVNLLCANERLKILDAHYKFQPFIFKKHGKDLAKLLAFESVFKHPLFDGVGYISARDIDIVDLEGFLKHFEFKTIVLFDVESSTYEILGKMICKLTRLENLICDHLGLQFHCYEKSYSIICFSLEGEFRYDWHAYSRRNKSARVLCRKSALSAALYFRKILSRDVANFIGFLVWESRGTKIWVRKNEDKKKLP